MGKSVLQKKCESDGVQFPAPANPNHLQWLVDWDIN